LEDDPNVLVAPGRRLVLLIVLTSQPVTITLPAEGRSTPVIVQQGGFAIAGRPDDRDKPPRATSKEMPSRWSPRHPDRKS
jgi:hypothetical protein